MPRFSTLINSSMLRVAGAVAALAVTAPFSAPVQAAVTPLACGRTIDGAGTWQSLNAPTFEAGLGVTAGKNITAFAVSPANSQIVAVTNGNSVYVSQNGGCNWNLGVRLDQVPSNPTRIPLSGSLTTIRGVYVSANGTVYAIAEEANTGATIGRPHVLRSQNAGRGLWELADTGLPPIGRPLTIKGHPKNGNVLYLTFSGAREERTCPPAPLQCPEETDGDALGLMYGSSDGGGSWSSRTEPGDLNSVTAIKFFSIDDDDATGNTLWLVAGGELQMSTDGGRTFDPPDGLDQGEFTFSAVETLRNTRMSGGLKVIAFSHEGEMIRLQRGNWIRSRMPFPSVQSVTQRPEGDIMVATDPSAGGVSLWRIFPGDFIDFENEAGFGGKTAKTTFGWELVNPRVALPVSADVQAGPAPRGDGTFYIRDNRRVLRYLKSRRNLGNFIAPGVNLNAPPPPKGLISPANLTLDIPSGKQQIVDYTLTLPPAPTPMDVFLLIDNSGSMSPIIRSLKEDLSDVVRSLHASRIDVNVGVGQINVEPDRQQLPIDNPETERDESKPLPIYQVLRKIGPVNGDLFQALSKMDGNGGSGKEPQLEALYQAIHGTGMSYNNLGWLIGYSIPPNHDAEFRDALDPIKIIVHATDEEFATDIQGDAHNDFNEVGRILKEAGVKQIGLSQANQYAAKDLGRMARLTGALAPKGGTDCDGDGVIGFEDVKAGQPLVCGQNFGLDKTLVNLIRSLADPQTITVTTKPTETMKAARVIDYKIDAKQPTKRTFSVTYTCKGVAPGQYINNIAASLRGLNIAKAVATINCGGVDRPPVRVGVAEEPAFNPPQPQPQPFAPAPAPVNPVPQPQSQIQVQTQVNPQAGMADQEEEQFQLATADNTLGLQDEKDQLAMTGMSYADNPAVVLSIGMAMASAAGVGMALSRRRRTSVAKVTTRRF